MKWYSLLSTIIFGGLLLLAGCIRQDSFVNYDGFTTESTDTNTGVVIRVHIPTDTITIADRITLDVNFQWAPPANPVLVSPNFDELDWTLIDTSTATPKLDNGKYSTQISYTLEPFLAGEYIIPPIVLDIFSNDDSKEYQLQSSPMTVTVLSVIDPADTGEISTPYDFMDASVLQTQESHSFVVPAFVTGMILFACMLILWIKYRNKPEQTTPLSAQILLNQVAHEEYDNPVQGYSRLHQALMLLDSQLHGTSEIHSFVQVCERAQFSLDQASAISPSSMAQHTLELLGQQNGSNA
tara:strand:+ start:333523 stop:334410 length:888 start_codon:yes stop_codon:yes gene_type:complete